MLGAFYKPLQGLPSAQFCGTMWEGLHRRRGGGRVPGGLLGLFVFFFQINFRAIRKKGAQLCIKPVHGYVKRLHGYHLCSSHEGEGAGPAPTLIDPPLKSPPGR